MDITIGEYRIRYSNGNGCTVEKRNVEHITQVSIPKCTSIHWIAAFLSQASYKTGHSTLLKVYETGKWPISTICPCCGK